MTEQDSRSGGNGTHHVAATIYDVARSAGVSKTTVSRVINHDANVSTRTRDKVEAAIRTLRYQPSAAARNLACKTEMRIGLLYNNPSVSYFNELMIGALESCGRHGAQLIVGKCTPGDPVAAENAIRTLAAGGLNGMLLTAPLSESHDMISKLSEDGIVLAGVATGKFRSDISCIGIDDCTAAREMTELLITQGHRHIAFIRGHTGHTSSAQRFLGFSAAMESAFGPEVRIRTVQGMNSYRSGMQAATEILRTMPEVTAIFAGNDDMASGALSAIHQRGISVPGDMSVAGFDDTIAATLWPELTTVRQPIFEIGAHAIDMIVENIARAKTGKPRTLKNTLIPHKLIRRASISTPRSHPL